MAVLTPTVVNTSRLTYVADEAIFVAEASNLPEPGRVYDDACDVGYTLVSSRTGAVRTFAQESTVRDREGDVQYWEYIEIGGNGRPTDSGLTLRVYND